MLGRSLRTHPSWVLTNLYLVTALSPQPTSRSVLAGKRQGKSEVHLSAQTRGNGGSGHSSVCSTETHSCSEPLRVTRCPGIGFLSRGDREIGVLWNVEAPTRPRLECLRETGLILRCDRKVGNPFQTKQGSRPSRPDQEGRKGSEIPGQGTKIPRDAE